MGYVQDCKSNAGELNIKTMILSKMLVLQ